MENKIYYLSEEYKYQKDNSQACDDPGKIWLNCSKQSNMSWRVLVTYIWIWKSSAKVLVMFCFLTRNAKLRFYSNWLNSIDNHQWQFWFHEIIWCWIKKKTRFIHVNVRKNLRKILLNWRWLYLTFVEFYSNGLKYAKHIKNFLKVYLCILRARRSETLPSTGSLLWWPLKPGWSQKFRASSASPL